MKPQIFLILFAINFVWMIPKIYAQTETKISNDSLPSVVKEELKKKYSNYKVNGVTMVTEKAKPSTYKIEVQKKNNIVELLYDANGNIIGKSKSKIYSYDGTEKPKSPPVKSNDGHNHQH